MARLMPPVSSYTRPISVNSATNELTQTRPNLSFHYSAACFL